MDKIYDGDDLSSSDIDELECLINNLTVIKNKAEELNKIKYPED